MTKRLLSKLPLSTWCLLAFCFGLTTSVLTGGNKFDFYSIALLLVISLVLISLKIRESAILLALALAVIMSNYYFFASSKIYPSACSDSRVLSQAKKFKNGFLYKVADGNQTSVINLATDDVKILDKIYLCRKQPLTLEPPDQKYVLAQFRNKTVYNIDGIKKLEDGKGLRRSLFDLSVRIKDASSKIYSGDQGVLAYGLLFGSSSDFSSNAKANFKKSGTTHLVAVSGYNVSIITSWLFGSLRVISKNFAGVFSVIILILFYFLTGGSASVLRAGIMGVVILVSKFIGRRVGAIHLLLLAAALILAFNPFAIYDWGFQLSFLATAGLFFLSPTLEQMLSFGKKSALIKIFCETLGAQIFVLPIMISNFGQISLIAPLSNLFILPFVPVTMLFVAISLIATFISPLLGTFFGGISNVLVAYIMSVINLAANIKFASISCSMSPIIGYLVGYAIVVGLTILLRRIVAERKVK